MALNVELSADPVIGNTHEMSGTHAGTVILNGLDISAYVREARLSTGVGDITTLELTLTNISVNRGK